MKIRLRPLTLVTSALAALAAMSLTSCVESSTLSGSTESTPPPAQIEPAAPPAPAEILTKHDAALRFLTAYVHLDRNMALKYATPEAVAKLDWNRPHQGNIPYYDDKMFLYYRGGLAKVYFQEVNGSYLISNLETHKR